MRHIRGLLEAFHDWLNWGVSLQGNSTARRKVFSANIAGLMGAVSLLLYHVPMLYSGNEVMVRIALAESPFTLIFLLTPWLNRNGWAWLARWTLAVSAVISQLFSIYLGCGSYLGTHTYFILFAIVPIFVFPLAEWRAILFLFVLNVGLYLEFEYVGVAPDSALLQANPDLLIFLRNSFTVTAFLTMLFVVGMMDWVATRNERTLERLSLTDTLTNLPNRRGFREALQREKARCRRETEPLAIMLLDIDHFKRVNDEYGHDAGDEVLRHFARILRAIVREANLVARIGGEEFVILMPDTALEEAAEVAERVRAEIEAHACLYRGHRIQITTSLGVGVVACDQPFESTYQRVDQALYQAKTQGRNRVVTVA